MRSKDGFPEAPPRNGKNCKLTPDLVFRDHYNPDFLGLKDTYSKKDLEAPILRELERFIFEIGPDLAFVARQIGRRHRRSELRAAHSA